MGALMQLVAYGAQDVYLTGNPQITFFKLVYRRHTNFAMESIQQTFNGNATFGNRVTCTVSRNGDLIGSTVLEALLPAISASNENSGVRWCDNVGQALVSSVEVEIGGQRIDRQSGMWMNIWNELTCPAGKRSGYNAMVGQQNAEAVQMGGRNNPGSSGPATSSNYSMQASNRCQLQTLKNSHSPYRVYVPLQFWFCNNPGLALPLIALQYHEVKVSVNFRPLEELTMNAQVAVQGDAGADGEWGEDASSEMPPTYSSWGPVQRGLGGSSTSGLGDCQLWVDYFYLDTDERRRFAQVAHEYLIKQVQDQNESIGTGPSHKLKLTFNHPCTELVWVTQSAASMHQNEWFDYSVRSDDAGAFTSSGQHVGDGSNPTLTAQVTLNGHDRMAKRQGTYFDTVQPYQFHTNTPSGAGINVYSFSLKPEDYQPSGSCNFSRIDNANLQLNLNNPPSQNGGASAPSITIFAVNYNILRIMSGMGGLAYSN
jgi:hypothetical protein